MQGDGEGWGQEAELLGGWGCANGAVTSICPADTYAPMVMNPTGV